MVLIQHGTSRITEQVIGAAIEVHRALGPGLLESSYRSCLAHELMLRGIVFSREHAIPITYKGLKLPCGYRADLIVENRVVVEIKAVDQLHPLHRAQLMTYLRLTTLSSGLLINFNVPVLKAGLRRILL